MSSAQKIIQAAAGNAAGQATYVEDVFSTYLYDAQSSSFSINNGIDLADKGGLVWIKKRSGTNNRNHIVFDSERGPDSSLYVNTTGAAFSMSGLGYTSTVFNSDGFTTGDSPLTNENNGSKYTSWTFAKQEKFFDVVTWTGNGVAGRTIAHNLGSVPGCIIVKRLNATVDWAIYHRGVDATNPQNYWMKFNTDAREDNLGLWNDTAPTSTEFTVGSSSAVNNASGTYVAYLFAHNDGDGEFGENADQDIIKCGSYLGNGSANGPEIDLGFEPQWLLMKDATTANLNNWFIFDVMRGIVTGGNDTWLEPNSADADNSNSFIDLTPTGFKITTAYDGFNENAATYIYIAIRRGPMKTPESGTEVFDLHTSSPSVITTGFPVDAILAKYATSNWDFVPRLTEGSLSTSTTSAEVDYSSYLSFASNTAFLNTGVAFNSSAANWCFRRAPGFFDVVAYTGDGSAGRTVNHNLGVVPELMIVICRNPGGEYSPVYVAPLGNTTECFLQLANASQSTVGGDEAWNSTTPTSSVFSVSGNNRVNASGRTYIAYLFATVPGVSKVGSYTGNGTSQTIDCGFSTGARFVLIKRTDASGNWKVMDTARGIVAGDDKVLELDNTSAESTFDLIDPDSSGFAVEGNTTQGQNQSGATYIFLAIA